MGPGHLLLTISGGCKPNHRVFSKGNITLTGVLLNGAPEFRNITIGSRIDTFAGRIDDYNSLTIDLGDGDLRPLKDLTVDLLNRREDVESQNMDEIGYDSDWPRNTVRLSFPNHVWFYVNGDQILQLRASSASMRPNSMAPKIGHVDSKRVYTLPLTNEQAVELFGNPDRVVDERRN